MQNIYRSLVIGLCLFFVFTSITSAQIQSTTSGGPWDSTWTWVGGIIPGITNDVIINGPVLASHAECNDLYISANGILENNYYLYDVTIEGNVINDGVIQNQAGAPSPFAVHVKGNITNNGTWINYKISLIGTSDQAVSTIGEHALQCEYFSCNKSTGALIFADTTAFEDVLILFPGSNQSASINPNSLIKLYNSKWTDGNLTGAGETSVIHGEGTYQSNPAKLYTLTMTNLTLSGEISISNCLTYGTIINNAILQNDNFGYSLTINGNITNSGTIRNCPNGSGFLIYLYGDAINNGTWTNQSLTFNGSNDQQISCTSGNVLESSYIINDKTAGIIQIPTDITFVNTTLQMNSKLCRVASGCILNLQNATINQGLFYPTLTESTFIFNSDASSNDINSEYGNIILTGVHSLSNVTYTGDVINNGLMQNDFYGFSATIQGTLINNDTIQSYPGGSGFTINLAGNIIQNGVFLNNIVNLTGNTIQEISCESGRVFSPYSLNCNNSVDEIHGLTNLRFENTLINLNNDLLVMSEGRILSLTGGKLENAHIEPVTGFTNSYVLHMENDAILAGSNLHNAILEGHIICTPTNFHGNIINKGIIENDFFTYTITFYGDLYNQGIIRNQPGNSPLFINLSGNVTNNGYWANSQTIFNGTNPQTITIRNNNSIQGPVWFESEIGTSPFEWAIDGVPIDPGNLNFSDEDTQSLAWLAPVSNAHTGVYNCNTGGGTSRNLIVEESYGGGLLDLNVFLEGSFNGTNLSVNLSDILPFDQPYNYPWEYYGYESVTTIPNDVVDWILVELRDADTIFSATAESTIGRMAAFLLNDGRIVDLDGNSFLSFNHTIEEKIYVVLWHRNHLPVISANSLTSAAGIYSYDFTSGADQAYNSNQADLGGVFGMYVGDFNADGIIDESDLIQKWNPVTGSPGYYAGDANMEGEVDNQDKNEKWLNNIGRTEQFPEGGFLHCGDILEDDRNGMNYNTVQIGSQCWMAENINIGTNLPGTSNQTDDGIIEKYCYDNLPTNCDAYGGLYQWREVMQYATDESSQGICPEGWHIPSHSEWCTMEQFLDPTVDCDATGWRGGAIGTELNEGGSSGFEALIVGQRQFNGTFDYFGFRGHFWTSTYEGSNYAATMRMIQSNDTRVFNWKPDWIYGYSVRCVWDGSK